MTHPDGGVYSYGFDAMGLVTAAEDRLRAGVSTSGRRRDFSWTQDGNSPTYLGAIVTTEDVGTVNQVQKKVTQTLDGWGNITQSETFDYGSLVAARTYRFTYLSDSNYTSRYIRNRLLTATVNGASLVTNMYDTTDATHTCNGIGVSNPQDQSNLTFHDADYGTTFLYRGNAVWTLTPSGLACTLPQITGVAAASYDGRGRVVKTTPSAATNYALPGTLSLDDNPQLTTTVGYNTAFQVTSVTGANGDAATTSYDGAGRPQSMTTADGQATNHSTTYAYTATTQTATLGSRWKKTTIDGFGRVVKVELGHDATTESQTESEYAPCGCSPLGKLKRTSLPHAPNAAIMWTTYVFDGLGRTISVTAPDGSATTYEYIANTVKATDEAGKWKKYGWTDSGT